MKHRSLREVSIAKGWLLVISIGLLSSTCPLGLAASPSLLTPHTQLGTSTVVQKAKDVLKPGSVGNSVKDVQSMLALMGYYSGPVDGNYGQSTADAVGRFQAAVGLDADGVIGPITWQYLLPNTDTLSAPPQRTPPTENTSPNNASGSNQTAGINSSSSESVITSTAGNLPILRFEDSGPSVKKLQERLAIIGLYAGPLDSEFGVQTEQAVINFQRRAGLIDDGVVGPATWQELLK